ncbi:hypothetical protein L916_11901, partial [Phytophthora nicotianae]
CVSLRISAREKLPACCVLWCPGADVYTEVSNPNWGYPSVVHTTQKKAWCDHATML